MRADPAIAELRGDRRHTVLELARVLARHCDWQEKTTWRPRALACAEIGSSRDPRRPLSVSAYKAARRVLEERGLLGLVAQGWTSLLRAAPLDDHVATSAVFVLTVPHHKRRRPRSGEGRPVNRPLTRSRSDLVQPPHAREEKTQDNPTTDPAPRKQPPLPRAAAAALGALPENRSEALAAARALHDRGRVLRRLSAEHLRHLYRPFWLAGWLPRDLLHAIDHDPRGHQHGYTAEVRSPAGWIRSRLAGWLDRNGTPLPSRSQQLAGDRQRVVDAQTARRAQDAAARAQAADYPAAAATAREMLTRALREASLTRPRPTSLPPEPPRGDGRGR